MFEVYDLETLHNCFLYMGLNVVTNEWSTFILHESRNDLKKLLEHLRELDGMIGYNNISFDYPIIHDILNGKLTSAEDCYQKAQELVSVSFEDRFKYEIPEWKQLIRQCDLYKINHFDNGAKRTSLKDLEFWMNFPTVQDMPIHHSSDITEGQIETVVEYCKNDIKATKAFYDLCKDKIDLRKSLGKQYGLSFTNSPDPSIGANIFLDLLSKDMCFDKNKLRKLRTFRKQICLKDIILENIVFNSNEFNQVLAKFKSTIVDGVNPQFSQTKLYKGALYDFALGGLHSCVRSGVYKENDEYGILDIDVASFYPNLSIQNGFRPAHLGEAFCKIYKQIYEDRAIAKKNGVKAINEGLKLALNGVFGKSGDKNSYLYDLAFLYSITVNGQLQLTQLIEQLVDNTNCTVLQANTDGVTIRYNREYYSEIITYCKDWEKRTKLELEYKDYSKMIIQDVNNYEAVDVKGNIKYKGLFEIEKEPYKDTSFKIVPIALREHFVNGIDPIDTIKNHKNIYDFCGRAKFKSDSFGEIRFIGTDKHGLPVEVREKQQKTTRYYISNKGSTFIKVYPEKKKEAFINKGYQVTIFNRFEDKKNYDIDYSFYYKEVMKIIYAIESKQLEIV